MINSPPRGSTLILKLRRVAAEPERGLITSQRGVHQSVASVREVVESSEDWKYGGHGRPPHDRPGDMDVVGERLPWKQSAIFRVDPCGRDRMAAGPSIARALFYVCASGKRDTRSVSADGAGVDRKPLTPGLACQKSGQKLVFLRSDIKKLLRNFVLDVCQQQCPSGKRA